MTDIDITKPITGAPTTQSVRDNFAAAATEIATAQAAADAAQTTADLALLRADMSHWEGFAYDFKVVVGAPFYDLSDSGFPGQFHGFYVNQEPSALGDTLQFVAEDLILGNYTMKIVRIHNAVSGIFELTQNGVVIDTADHYRLAQVLNAIQVIPVVIEMPNTVFEFRAVGTNPASGQYYHLITRVVLHKD